MKPTPHVHAELIKQWADAPEWWDVYFYTKSFSEWHFTETPSWYGEHKYELRKSAKHPDNIKPKKKLIDWSKMPRGTMTNYGEIIGIAHTNRRSRFIVLGSDKYSSQLMLDKELRLAEQTEFTYWGGGECPVPEGVIVEAVFRRGDSDEGSALDFEWQHSPRSCLNDDRDIIAYRITGLVNEWTDNLEDAA
jgi:hypothetical protein